jgi:hypothetical protein
LCFLATLLQLWKRCIPIPSGKSTTWSGAIPSKPNLLYEFISQFVDEGTETTGGLDENAISDIAGRKCFGLFLRSAQPNQEEEEPTIFCFVDR